MFQKLSILPLVASVIASLTIPSTAAASTFIVDAANGPGTHFTTIAAAVAAVPDGSVLDIRPGGYGLFQIVGKGLTLLGGPGVFLTAPGTLLSGYEIANTQPGQTVILRGFTFAEFRAALIVSRCQGPVYLEEIWRGVTYCGCVYSPPTTYWLSDAEHVQLRDCDGWGLAALSSSCFLERCIFEGYGALCGLGSCTTPAPALSVWDSAVQCVDSTLQGGSGGGGGFYPVRNNLPGIQIRGGSIRLLGSTIVRAGTNSNVLAAPAIDGFGELRLDPSVVVQSAANPAISIPVVTTVRAMPVIAGNSASPGAALIGVARGPLGASVYLFVGWPGPLFTWPEVEDPFGFDPALYWLVNAGVPQAGTPVQVSVSVPADPTLRGVQLVWQSLSADAQGLQVSNPAVVFVY